MLRTESARSLDDVLCDPELAREFDDRAAAFAPGFRPLQYRWAALKLRKAGQARPQPRLDSRGSARLPSAISSADLGSIRKLPDAPGIYLVTGDKNKRL